MIVIVPRGFRPEDATHFVIFYLVVAFFGPETTIATKKGSRHDASHVDSDGGLRGHLRFYTPTLPLPPSLSLLPFSAPLLTDAAAVVFHLSGPRQGRTRDKSTPDAISLRSWFGSPVGWSV